MTTERGARWRKRESWPASHVLIACVPFLMLLVLTWRRWADPFVDFPEELYVPWQLSEGKVLYRDIHHYYGPLSQYYHALLFWVFGPSFTVIFLSNALLVLLLLLVLYRAISTLASPGVAVGLVAAIGVLVPVQQIGRPGGYNFLAPYSHEATHGAMLAFAMWSLSVVDMRGRGESDRQWLIWLLFGLACLCKPEPLLAGLGILLVDTGFRIRRLGLGHLWEGRRILALCAWAALPGFVAFLSFLLAMDPGMALQSTLGAIAPFWASDLAAYPLFERMSGATALRANLHVIVIATLGTAGLVVSMALLDRWVSRWWRPLNGRLAAWMLGAVVFAATLRFPFFHATFAFPVIAACTAAYLGVVLVLRGRMQSAWWALLGLSIFAVVYSLRIFFLGSFKWLGFVLLFPSAVLMFLLHLWLMPDILRRRYATGSWYRVILAGLVATFVWQHANLSLGNLAQKNVTIGRGGDRMYAFPTTRVSVSAEVLSHAVRQVERRVPPDATLLAVPEGVLVNYLTRRENPTPYMQTFLLKPHFDAAGGTRQIIAVLDSTPPDYILYLGRRVEVPGAEYQIRGPGGFANDVFEWIESHYEVVDRLGPLSKDFGQVQYVLLKRRA